MSETFKTGKTVGVLGVGSEEDAVATSRVDDGNSAVVIEIQRPTLEKRKVRGP